MPTEPTYEVLYAQRLAAAAEIRRLRELIRQSERQITRLENQQTGLDAQAFSLQRASTTTSTGLE